MSQLIAIDFDGTVVEEHYPEIGPLVVGAEDGIRALHRYGHRLILWTCREDDLLADAIDFLREQRLWRCFIGANRNCKVRMLQYGDRDIRKIGVDLYIDDRVPGGLLPWREIVRLLCPNGNG